MMRIVGFIGLILAVMPLNVNAKDHLSEAPSGLIFAKPEVIFEPKGVPAAQAKTLRLRFVSAEIADTEKFSFDRLESDLEFLCVESGIEIARRSAPQLERIIVSISSVPIALGETAPSVVQYFDAFMLSDNTCIWEGI